MARHKEYDLPVIVMPTLLRRELIVIAHSQGHFGIQKVVERLLNVAWWPTIKDDVAQVINNCLQCAANNADTKIIKGPHHHQQIVGPWERLQLDYIGPLPTTARGFKYVLVIIDSFSKWVEAYPTRNNTALTTAKKLVNETIARFGIPHTIDSDQGPHFIGEVIKHLSIALGINWKLHIAGHPQSSGLVERTNRTLKAAMRKMVNSSGKNWDQQLPIILMAIRSTIGSHGFTPHEIVTGRKMRTPEVWWVQGGVPPDEFQNNVKISKWVSQLLEHIAQVQIKVAHQLGANMQTMNNKLNAKFKCIEWEIGQKVLYKWFSETGHVLSPKWVGPFPITNKAGPTVYQLAIKDHEGHTWLKWFHSTQLKPWKGNQETPPLPNP
ncbi:protein NYNRIN-like [Emydura macquarii macquarii]|uniref:protein NYNRIN-like n=1 Tax=Emydura macquarii macquarii TaxID=1129001 RepID=UPI00352A81F5